VVPYRTRVPVVTRAIVEPVDAPCLRRAAIIGARIVIVAVGHLLELAAAIRTVIAQRTLVFVVALDVVGRVLADTLGIAQVVRTWIAVIAIHNGPRRTLPVDAEVVHRTGVAVAARSADVLVVAAQLRGTEVLGARICIVAVDVADRYTLTARTMVSVGAGISVITVGLVFGIDASRQWSTRVVSALVEVVADDRLAGLAFAVGARVVRSTRVQIRARISVVNVSASFVRVARIVGTHVSVVAVGRRPPGAASIHTRIPHRAHVSVVTRKSFMVGHKGTDSRIRGARRLQTDGLHPGGFGTRYHRFRIYLALVGQLRRVAIELPVAHIPVIELLAVLVFLAVA